MENLRKHVDVKLVTSKKGLHKLSAKPNFNTFKIFNENLIAVNMRKAKLKLNRPIFVGFSILDVSKTLMYDFHYNYIKEKYGEDAVLMMTDTDSLCYLINTSDIYRDMQKDGDLFDFSGYPKDHPLYSEKNKKVLGKMKDELNGIPGDEMVGLRSKMYSLLYGDEVKKTAKGVKKYIIDTRLKHDMYKSCLFNQESRRDSMNMIRSENHQLHTITVNKVSLSPFDDKRYLLSDGVTSLAYGHHAIIKDINASDMKYYKCLCGGVYYTEEAILYHIQHKWLKHRAFHMCLGVFEDINTSADCTTRH